MNITNEFLKALFASLNREKIKYCILRNYDTLPEKIRNDVDIWVDKIYWGRFFQIVEELANTLNYTLNYTPRLTTKGEGDYFLSKFMNNKLNIIHLDCWAYLHWRGLCFVDESIMPDHLIWNEKGFYIPSAGVESAINLLKGLIHHRKVDNKYKEKIHKFINEDPQTFLQAIEGPFGRNIARFIFERSKNKDWDNLEKKATTLRMILFLRSFRTPFSQVIKWFYYFRAQIRRFFINPSGLFIVFIGPDGSGKTTIANELLNSEIKKLFQKKIYFHGHFPFLPELKKIVGIFKRNKVGLIYNQNINTNLKPFNIFRSMIYPIYYGLNYFLGHWLIWKEKARGSLIVFDRYFYDYLIQRQFINCPRWLICTIASLIPKPDIIIYLKNQPEVIFSRKSELTIKEIKRQSDICQNLVKKLKNCYVVTTNSTDEVIDKIQRIIIEKKVVTL